MNDVKHLLLDYPEYKDAKLALSKCNCHKDFEIDGKSVLNSFYGALFTASALIDLMNSVDYACRFSTIDNNQSFPIFIHGPFGIFFHNPVRPKPSYYAFKMFNSMSKMEYVIWSSADNKHIDVISGRAANSMCIIIDDMNYGLSKIEVYVKNLPWKQAYYKIIVLNQSNYDSGNALDILKKGSIKIENGELYITFESDGLSLYLIEINGHMKVTTENSLYAINKILTPL